MGDPTKTKRGESKAQRIARLKVAADKAAAELEAAEREIYPGRPPKYKAEFAARATDLCLLGLTNEELGERFGVNVQTIDMWIAQIPDFARAIYAGREGADAEVARSMYKAALGYAHRHDEIKVISLGNNQGSQIEIVPTVKHYPPDPKMAAMWMNSRQRKRFQVHPSGSQTPLGELTPEELAAQTREAIAAALSEIAEPTPPTTESKEP